jgi:hypothetical protein
MEAERRAARDTDAVARDNAENQSTGREAAAVDHDALPGASNGCIAVDVLADSAADIVADPNDG